MKIVEEAGEFNLNWAPHSARLKMCRQIIIQITRLYTVKVFSFGRRGEKYVGGDKEEKRWLDGVEYRNGFNYLNTTWRGRKQQQHYTAPEEITGEKKNINITERKIKIKKKSLLWFPSDGGDSCGFIY